MKFDGTEDQLSMLRDIADNIHDPVFLVDRQLNVWYYNRPFEASVGVRLSSRRYKGMTCRELLGLEICEHACVMRQAIDTGKAVRVGEIAGKTAGGEKRNYLINAVAVSNSAGNPFGALVFLRDMTAETTIHQKYRQLVAKNSTMSLSGKLAQGGLVDVLQLLSFLQKSGTLSVRSGGGEGTLIIEAGRIVSIELGGVWSEKAFGRMLNFGDGEFAFRSAIGGAMGELLERPGDFVIMDGLRELDELNARRQALPADSTIIKPTGATPPAAELEPLARAVLDCLGAGKSLRELIDGLPQTDARIYLATLALKDQGLVVW